MPGRDHPSLFCLIGDYIKKHETTLIILDMINTFEFPQGEALRREANKIAPYIGALRQWVRHQGGDCYFVNDNFGKWDSNFPALIDTAKEKDTGELLQHLMPRPHDALLFRPKHSAFFDTPLASLIRKTERVLIAGVATEACVMATALDAHMHEFNPVVVSDCVASATDERRASALKTLGFANIAVEDSKTIIQA